MKQLHTCLCPSLPQINAALDMLPDTLQNDEVIIACYTRHLGEVVVAGYYLHKGFYEGNIAFPDGFSGDISASDSIYSQKARAVTGLSDCWAGGDTGGFYQEMG